MTTPLLSLSSSAAYSIKIRDQYFTRKTRYGRGQMQRLSEDRFPTRTVTLPLAKMPVADRNTLYAFFKARLGAGESFHYIHNRQEKIVDEYVGYATGVEQTLDIPSKETINDATLILYDEGTPIAKTFSSGTGENGVDQVIFTATVGSLMTVDCYGKLRLLVYMDDEREFEWFRYLHQKTELTLYEEPVVT